MKLMDISLKVLPKTRSIDLEFVFLL